MYGIYKHIVIKQTIRQEKRIKLKLGNRGASCAITHFLAFLTQFIQSK